MKKLILSFAFLSLLAGSARGDVILGTSNPPGTPLTMMAGTISGPMLVNVVSNNFPNDVLAGWQFSLVIVPQAGVTGTLSFQDPSAGIAPNPPNYIFGSNGLGITVPSNTGSELGPPPTPVNDFLDPNVGLGTAVPGAPGANLLQLDFLASPSASGLFGIYAVKGDPNTIWTDDNMTTQFFTNVPDGTGSVHIGDVLVTRAAAQAVPEPSSLMVLGLGGAALAGWACRRQRKKASR